MYYLWDTKPVTTNPQPNAMTNAQHLQASAIENMNAKKLSSYEIEFVSRIENYDKKKLNSLSSSQYRLLDQCANK